MEIGCRYRICGNRVWTNDRLVELDSAVVKLALYYDHLAELGITVDWVQGPAIAGTAIGRNGTAYDIDPQGTVIRTLPGRSAGPAVPGLSSNVVISVERHMLRVGEKAVELAGLITQIVFLRDVTVVAVEPKSADDVNNVFGVNMAGEVVWRIQTPDCADKIGGAVPYGDVSVSDGRLTVTDGWGRVFATDPESGRIVGGILGVNR